MCGNVMTSVLLMTINGYVWPVINENINGRSGMAQSISINQWPCVAGYQ